VFYVLGVYLFNAGAGNFSGCDFSASTSTALVHSSNTGVLEFNKCIFKAGTLPITSLYLTSQSSGKVKLTSCGEGDEYYYNGEADAFSVVNTDTDNYLDATYDDTNGFSYQLNSSAETTIAKYMRFKIYEKAAVDLTSNTTFRVNLNTDNVRLNDVNCWLEIVTPASSTDYALGQVHSTRNTDILDASPVDLELDVTNTWPEFSGTDMEQYISHQVDAISGVDNATVEVWVCFAEPSEDLWACPQILIT